MIGNTWAWPVNGDKHFERFAAIAGGSIARVGNRLANLMVRLTVPFGHKFRKPTWAEMKHYLAALDTPVRRRACSILPKQIIAGHEFLSALEAKLPELAKVPALLLRADKDDAFRPQELQRWQLALPNAVTVPLHGARHFVPSDAPVAVAGAIREWHPGR